MRPFKSRPGRDDPRAVRLAAALLAAALALPALPAGAEMYECTGPDGSPVFTSNPAVCPGSSPHAPSRDVQRVEPGSEPPAAPTPRAAPTGRDLPGGEDAQAATWKRKRLDAEAELRDVERRFAEFQEVVGWCNKGGDLVVEDRVGVRQDYSCEEARAGLDGLSARRAELRRYLAGGLEDECRRAGCLPGWIR